MIALGLHIPTPLILVITFRMFTFFYSISLKANTLPTLFAGIQLFKLVDKDRPETKQAEKERLSKREATRFVELQ